MATYAANTWIFIKDDEDSYVPAKVIKGFKAGEATDVQLYGEGKKTKRLTKDETLNEISHMDKQSNEMHENMVALKSLNDASILHNLRLRFEKDKIYTNIGTILVSVNPFKLLPIYTPRVLEQYMNQGSRELPPHVYGVADNAYRAMSDFKQSQSCIVSGESGAGKTEATKLFLQYIAEVSSSNAEAGESIQDKILEANPLMEAFGNAKTVRNDNSSRFGKWISIEFDANSGTIIGSSIESYLLEKSRIVTQAEKERNYHIFYQLCASASMDPAYEKLKIQDAAQYYYLNQSKKSATTVKGMDDTREFSATRSAMETMGLKKEEENIVTLLAAILHLGNINFASGKDGNSSKIENEDMLKLCSSQFGFDAKKLSKALTERSVRAGRDIVFSPNNVDDAKRGRDALAKGVYGLLFNWIIAKINESLKKTSQALAKKKKSSGSKSSIDSKYIGVLDIFGFEIFEHNSFEQLCINYCNEKLQGHFNNHVFKLEQKYYKDEGIKFESIEFEDNDMILNKIEGKGTGVLAQIDEELKVRTPSEEKCLTKIQGLVDNKVLFKAEPKEIKKNKDLANTFTILHYAGKVTYHIEGFIEKNKDKLHEDLSELCAASKKKLMKTLFSDTDKKANNQSLGSQFKAQLHQLMKTLGDTEPHFIRCIKPNSEKKKNLFTSPMVLDQLTFAGLLEVCKIRAKGFPVRKKFKEFMSRYGVINVKSKDAKDLCKVLETKKIFKKGEYHVGKTQVFMRNEMFNKLEEGLEVALIASVTIIKRVYLKYRLRSNFKKLATLKRKLHAAVKKEDEKLLEEAILESGKFSRAISDSKVVREARQFYDQIVERRQLIETLEDAMKTNDIGKINGAIKACKSKGLEKDKLVTKAKKMVKNIENMKQTKEDLRKAIKSKDKKKLDALLKNAKDLKMMEEVEVRDAQALLDRLENEEKTRGNLSKAIKSKKTEDIKKFVTELLELGVDNDDKLVLKAEEVAKIQAEISVKQTNQIAQMEKDLQTAMEKKDLVRLNELEVRVIELGITNSKVVEKAMETRAKLEEDKSKAAKLQAEVLALSIKAGSLDGVTNNDTKGLAKLIKSAASEGIEDGNPVVVEAKALMERVKKQVKVQEKIEKAMKAYDKSEDKDEAALKAALAEANQYGIQTSTAKTLQSKVRQIEADKKVEKRGDKKVEDVDIENTELRHPTKAELQQQAMRRLAKSNSKKYVQEVKKASKEFYHFTKFFQIRSDEDYTQYDLQMSKASRAKTKLKYQPRRISNSILELDRDLAKVAVRNHKALLGYTGDVASNSFSTTLAQDIIIRGLEIPDLIDEIYIQLCKHLTENGKADSRDRGWLLMCMCTKHFPPSQDFKLYLMNFFIENRGVPGLIGNYARLCLFQLDATLSLQRTNLIPPLYDIKMYTKRPPILVEVHNVKGEASCYAVTPDITVAMLVGMCATFQKVSLQKSKQFGIFVKDSDYTYTYGAGKQQEAPVKKKRRGLALPVSSAVEAAMDLFDGAQKFLGFTQRQPLPSPQSSWPLMGATYPGDVYLRMAKQDREPIFSFKRKLLLSKEDEPKADQDLYLQLLDEVLFGNLLIKNDDDRVKLVTIAMAIVCGKEFPKSTPKLLEAGLMKYVPITWRMRKPSDKWGEDVLAAQKSLKNVGLEELYNKFTEICRSSPVYGMCFFSVYRQDNNKDFICGINHVGVHLLNEKLELQYTFKYGNIQKFGASARYVWIKVVLKSEKVDLAKEVKRNNSILQLYTLQSTEMYGLIYDYTHRNTKK